MPTKYYKTRDGFESGVCMSRLNAAAIFVGWRAIIHLDYHCCRGKLLLTPEQPQARI